MKKTIISLGIIASVFAFTFVGNNIISRKQLDSKTPSGNQEVNSEQNDKVILEFKSNLDLAYDLTNKKVINNTFDYIALIKIDKIDGVDNYDSVINQYVSPYTYGSATVLNAIKGNIGKSNISFRRLGGQISFKKWLEGDEAPDKILRIREESGLANVPVENIIVDYKNSSDINVEEGKIYLAFLEYNQKLNKENEYWIGGLQYGLREVQGANATSDKIDNVTDLKVKNNNTGKWENITDVVVIQNK